MAKKYDASSIQVLEGLDAVRMRPGMYIGSTGSRGLHHLLWEIVDNAIDEAMGGYAHRCDGHPVQRRLRQRAGQRARHARGHPPHHGRSAVRRSSITKLHAGGKFNNENYAYSGGLHGVGASVVNALSPLDHGGCVS